MKQWNKTLALLLILALILALPVLAEGEQGTYRDVPEDAWFAQAAEYCAAQGLMNGVSEDSFDPNGGTTRAMVVTVLYRLSGSPVRTSEKTFPDVAADSWYADPVTWAALEGVTTGREDGLFAPDEAITRQDLAVFLWRSLGSPAALGGEPFADEAEIGAYALEAVRWARGAGIVNGMGDGSFAPKKGATRAELAAILMRLSEKVLVSRLNIPNAKPCGLALDKDGSLLVTDTYHKCVWRVKDGQAVRIAGAETAGDLYDEPMGSYVDAEPEKSCFRQPWAIVPFLEGWAISDTRNNALRFLDEVSVQTVNAAPGEEGLPSGDYGVTYERPTGLAVDEAGNLYASDTGAGAIRVITPNGIASTLADGLDEPTGLCWYAGSLYVAETGAHRILKITGDTVEVLAGSGEEGFLDGAAAAACFSSPMGVTVDKLGRVFVADTVNGAVRCIAEGQVTTLLRAEADTPLNSPLYPVGLLAAEEGLFVADNFTGRLLCIGID